MEKNVMKIVGVRTKPFQYGRLKWTNEMRRTSAAHIHMVVWVSKAPHDSVDGGTTPRPMQKVKIHTLLLYIHDAC